MADSLYLPPRHRLEAELLERSQDMGFLGDWVRLFEPTSEAAPIMHLSGALALASAAIGWRAYAQWGAARFPAPINIVLTGTSGVSHKSTAAENAIAVSRGAGALGSEMCNFTQRVDTWFSEETQAERCPPFQATKLGHVSDRGLYELVAPPDEDTAKTWRHVPPPGMLVFWDEFGSALGRPGDLKGADWLGRLRVAMINLASGESPGIQTGQMKIPPSRCSLAFLATMTRDELEQRFRHGLVQDGFLGRFLIVASPGKVRRLAIPPKWGVEELRQQDALARWVVNVSRAPEWGCVFDKMTPEAREARIGWYETWDVDLAKLAEREPTERHKAVHTAWGRLQNTQLLIAAIAAIAQWDGETPFTDIMIDRQHVNYGSKWVMLALREIAELAAVAETAPADKYAEKVVEFLRTRPRQSCTRSELMTRVPNPCFDRGRRWRIVEELHKDGAVKIEVEQTGGRPKMTVTLLELEE